MTEADRLIHDVCEITASDHEELIEKLYSLPQMKAYKDIQSKYILEFVATYGPVIVISQSPLRDHMLVSLRALRSKASLILSMGIDRSELRMYPLVLNVPILVGLDTYRTILYHDRLLSTPGIYFTITKTCKTLKRKEDPNGKCN